MKRFTRLVALAGAGALAAAGLVAVGASPASALIPATVSINSGIAATPNSWPAATGLPLLSTDAPCVAGSTGVRTVITGGQIPAGQELLWRGTTTTSPVFSLTDGLSIPINNNLVAIGNLATPAVTIIPPTGVATYTVKINCTSTFGSVIIDSFPTIQINVNAAGTASVVVAAVNTTTTVAASPNPAASGSTITLTSTVTAASGTTAPTGSVQFTVSGATPAITVPAVTTSTAAGAVSTFTTTITAPTIPAAAAAQTLSVSAAFTDGAAFNASASTTPATVVVNPQTPAQATATAIAVNNPATSGGTGAAGPVTITGTVTAGGAAVANNAGTCSFFNGATQLAGGVALGVAPNGQGVCSYTASAGFQGAASFTVVFTSSNTANFTNSTSPAFTATYPGVDICSLTTGTSPLYTTTGTPTTPAASTPFTGSQCIDPQTITVTVPTGNLIISTPYTPTAPFDLGTVQLNAAGTAWSISKAFGSAANPAQGVSITDTRAGNLPFTASVRGVDFTSPGGGTIAIGKLGFTGLSPLYITGNRLTGLTAPTTVTTTAIPALTTASQAFATGTGPGSVFVVGTLGLTDVPTSTTAGLYTTTLTFTIA